MSSSFNAGTPVLNLGGKSPADAHQVWLLWPVHAFRALIPAGQETRLNLFQRAVLGLALSGVRTAHEIAERLDLSGDLVAFVMCELQARRLLDPHGHPTQDGRTAADGAQAPSSARASALVFVDAVSNVLWPRVHMGSATYAASSLKGAHGSVELNSVGRSFKATMTAVCAVSGYAPPPSARALLQAFRQDHRDGARARNAAALEKERRGWTTLAEAEVEMALEGTIDRVTLASRQSEPMYIPVQLYIPRNVLVGTRWRVRDPFYGGDSQDLYHLVRSAIDHGTAPQVRNALDRLMEHVGVTDEGAGRAHEQQRAHAEDAVRAALGSQGQVHEKVWRHLVEMERCLPKRADGAQEAAGERHRDFVRHAYAALEQQFAAAQAALPTNGVLAALSTNAERNSRTLASLATTRLGFVLSESGPDRAEVERLLSVSRNSCRNVVDFGGVGLPEQLAIAILLANQHPAHPLADLGRARPDALTTMALLRRARNGAAHATSDEARGTLASRARSLVYETVRCMGRLTATDESAAPGEHARTNDLSLDLTVLTLARYDVDRSFGPALRAYPTLMDLTVRHRAEALRAQQLLASEASGLDCDVLTGNLAVKASAVAEAAFASLLALAPSPASLGLIDTPSTSVPPRIPDRLLNAALEVGVATVQAPLSDAIAQVKTAKIAGALERPSRATLASLVAAALLCAQHDETQGVGRTIRMAPHLVRDAAHLARLRGHGGPVQHSDDTIRFLSDAPADFVRATLSTQ